MLSFCNLYFPKRVYFCRNLFNWHFFPIFCGINFCDWRRYIRIDFGGRVNLYNIFGEKENACIKGIEFFVIKLFWKRFTANRLIHCNFLISIFVNMIQICRNEFCNVLWRSFDKCLASIMLLVSTLQFKVSINLFQGLFILLETLKGT